MHMKITYILYCFNVQEKGYCKLSFHWCFCELSCGFIMGLMVFKCSVFINNKFEIGFYLNINNRKKMNFKKEKKLFA